MATITKEHAVKIAGKLKATLREGSAHTSAEIFHEGRLVASFGIRRGSKKDQGHGHIKNDLYLSLNQTKQLAACPLSREQWLEILKDKELLKPAARAQ
jgi:hypothetical protein